MTQTKYAFLSSLLVTLVATCGFYPVAQAADVTVNCNARRNNSINAALGTLNKRGPNTVRVSGTCNEAVVIDGFDRLTLVGNPTATINDPTPSANPELEDTTVIFIADSDRVLVQGITVNGGALGIVCQAFSICHLQDVHVHGSVGNGVSYARSSGFIRDNTVIEDNAGVGLQVIFGSNVGVVPFNTTVGPTIQNNGEGALVADDGHLRTFAAFIQNNVGIGIRAERGSNVLLALGAVTGNGGDGLFLRSSTASLIETTITGNTGNGVEVANLSFARFAGGNTINANGAPDVNCASTTAVTIGTTNPDNLAGGGTTNCTEPAP